MFLLPSTTRGGSLMFRCATLCGLLGIGVPAAAAIFCVSNGDELSEALRGPNGNFASVNGEDDSVRLRPGTYTTLAGAVGGPSWVYDVNRDGRSLSISGGWNSNCTSQTIDPTLTVLSGRSAGTVLVLSDRQSNWGGVLSGTLSVSNLTLANGRTFEAPTSVNGFRPSAALGIHADDAQPGTVIVVENIVMTGSSAASTARRSIVTEISMNGGTTIRFRNNVIHGNNMSGAINTDIASIEASNNAFSVVSNNSIFGNVANGAVGLVAAGVMTLRNNVIVNNVRGNGASDFQLQSTNTSSMTITHNHLGSFGFAGTVPAQFSDNTSGPPQWSGSGPFMIPDAGSPLRDSGNNAVLGGLGSTDVRGLPRVVNTLVDRGAVEAQPPANTGPLITALEPLNNSTTILPPTSDPIQTTRVFFLTQNGTGTGRTTMDCQVTAGNGAVVIRPIQSVANGGFALPVDVALDNPIAGTGQVQATLSCDVYPENAGHYTLTYFFVVRDPMLFRNAFE